MCKVALIRNYASVLAILACGLTVDFAEAADSVPAASQTLSVPTPELPEAALEKRTSFYEQSNFDRRTGDAIIQSRIEIPLWRKKNFQFHVGSEISEDSQSNSKLIYNDNYASAIAGVSWTSQALGLGARVDALYLYRSNVNLDRESPWSPGAKAVAFHYAFKGSERRRLFVETYSEFSFETWIANDEFVQHWTKAGFRLPVVSHLFVDLYPELLAKVDRQGYAYADFSEVRAGGRILFTTGLFQAFISATTQTPLFLGPKEMKSPLIAELVLGAEL